MTRADKVRAIVKEVSGKSSLPGDDASLFDAQVLDSFALADLVAAIEGRFPVKVPDSDLRPRVFESVEKIDAYLAKRGV